MKSTELHCHQYIAGAFGGSVIADKRLFIRENSLVTQETLTLAGLLLTALTFSGCLDIHLGKLRAG